MLWLQWAPRDLFLSYKYEIYPGVMIIMYKSGLNNFNINSNQIVPLDQGFD